MSRKRIEDRLKVRSEGDSNNFRLCDYFDLIAGTSTGSIIAAGLSTRMSIDELIALYETLGKNIFRSTFLRWGIFRPKFSAELLRVVHGS